MVESEVSLFEEVFSDDNSIAATSESSSVSVMSVRSSSLLYSMTGGTGRVRSTCGGSLVLGAAEDSVMVSALS